MFGAILLKPAATAPRLPEGTRLQRDWQRALRPVRHAFLLPPHPPLLTTAQTIHAFPIGAQKTNSGSQKIDTLNVAASIDRAEKILVFPRGEEQKSVAVDGGSRRRRLTGTRGDHHETFGDSGRGRVVGCWRRDGSSVQSNADTHTYTNHCGTLRRAIHDVSELRGALRRPSVPAILRRLNML